MSKTPSSEILRNLAPVYLKANRLMAIIIILLFLATLVMATINARWASAILIGLGAMLIPFAAMHFMPMAIVTRLLVASSLMVFSALQIHLLSGMIEAHFMIFILLSMLLAYRDWRVIICAATVIATHHVLFCYLQHGGLSVYVMPETHMASPISMVLVHAAYVVVQSIALCVLSRQMEKDAITTEELSRLSSHIGRRQGVFDLGFSDTAMQSDLGGHFKRTMLAVRSTLDSVSHSITRVSSISENITQGNDDLSSRNKDQDEALTHTISELKALSKTVHGNSANAQEANVLADGVGQVADEGRQLVDELTGAMSEMRESSRKISDITDVIDNIAFQTNILALNASVEAARAGSHGRGFAVVASEVRALAQKSATASHDIRRLIEASQQQVVHSASKADDVAENMGDILEQTRKVTLIIGEISAASREQSDGINNVSAAVNSIGDATRENSLLADEVTKTAENLRQQADELSQAVRVFELRGAASEPALQLPPNITKPQVLLESAPVRRKNPALG